MGVASVQMFSEALGKWTTYSVILPERGDGPFPVLFQLHGLSDDHSAWIQRSNLVRHVGNLPLIVVLPDGGTSGYVNWKAADRLHKHRYEDFIASEIPAHLRRNFNVSGGMWAIGGLSMGGYGAMRLGLKYADRFASIWAHSSAFHIGEYATNELTNPEDMTDVSVYGLADRVKAAADQPVISFDCGTEDELLQHNRDFDAHLTAIGLEHHYAEHPGGHTWDFWDDHVREALAQHARVLGITPFDSGN